MSYWQERIKRIDFCLKKEYSEDELLNQNMATISACLVVYNEEKVIEKCLSSIKGLADEIIIVHDGQCSDRTLEIAKKYTNKIFIREHIGEAEPHRAFSFNQASGDWILQIDADEFLNEKDFPIIRQKLLNPDIGGLLFQWEMWTGSKSVIIPGFRKMCFIRKDSFHYCGVPHEAGTVDKRLEKTDITLFHRPAYNNIAWRAFLKKRAKWVPVHAKYFFPELVSYDCFNTSPEKWIKRTERVKKYIAFYILVEPFKMFLGQQKNGLWKSWSGINISMQHFYYYLTLYLLVRKMKTAVLPKEHL